MRVEGGKEGKRHKHTHTRSSRKKKNKKYVVLAPFSTKKEEGKSEKKRQACGTQDDNCLYLAHLFYPGDKLAAPLPMFLPHLLAGGI